MAAMEPIEPNPETYAYEPGPARPTAKGGFDARRILRVLLPRVKRFPIFLGVMLVGGILYLIFAPPEFESTAIIKLIPKTPANSDILDAQVNVPYPGSADKNGTFEAVVESDNVAKRLIQLLRLDQTDPDYKKLLDYQMVAKIHKKLKLNNLTGTDLWTLTAQAKTAQMAADMANTWITAVTNENLDLSHKEAESKLQFLQEQMDEYEKKIKNPNRGLNATSKSDDAYYTLLVTQFEETKLSENVTDAGLIVMTPAAVPYHPSGPRKARTLAIVLFLALVLYSGYAFLAEWAGGRVRGEQVLQYGSGLPGYPLVPDLRDELERKPSDFKATPGDASLVTNPALSGSRYGESFKVLGASLSSVRTEFPLRSLGFFSPRTKEGKSLVASNLAISIARSGRRVLMVDADLKDPSLAKIFKVTPAGGGFPALLGGAELAGLAVESGIRNLWILPTPEGAAADHASPQDSDALGRAIEAMKKDFDLMVFDTAPLLPSADPLILATRLDGAVLMARWDATLAEDFTKALKYLRSVEAPLLGTLLNGVRMNQGLPLWFPKDLGPWLWQE